MNKIEFLQELEGLLYSISAEEREEAIQYYRDYFEDAGIENERKVIASLGSPRQVANTILKGLEDEGGSRGEFSEAGFRGYEECRKEEVIEIKKKHKWNTAIIILIVIAGVFFIPFWGSVASGILGIIFSIITVFICLVFGVAIAGISIIVTGAYLLIWGGATIFSSLYAGICLLGAGCFLLGIGILLVLGGVKIITIVIPWVIKQIVKIGKIPFAKKGEAV